MWGREVGPAENLSFGVLYGEVGKAPKEIRTGDDVVVHEQQQVSACLLNEQVAGLTRWALAVAHADDGIGEFRKDVRGHGGVPAGAHHELPWLRVVLGAQALQAAFEQLRALPRQHANADHPPDPTEALAARKGPLSYGVRQGARGPLHE